MNRIAHVISCGGGWQSSCMSLMAAAGEIEPMPIRGVFADTGAEPKKVYDWLDWLEKQLPFPLIRVSRGDLKTDSLKTRINRKTGKPYYSTVIPAFVLTAHGRGMLHRKCTYDYKMLPLGRGSQPTSNVWERM